jgi:Domain of unknown function (DUF4258)
MIDLSKIRAASRDGRIKWRYHALLRAAERGITRERALRVLYEGEVLEQRPDAKPFPKCLMMRIEEDNRPLYVSIGYDEEIDTLYVITVHWLDPEKWDDPWTRREKKGRTAS